MVNGLGLAASTVEVMSADFELLFSLLPETPNIYPAWKSLVSQAGVIGKQVHDARLVAVCRVHKLSHLMTFNTAHFVPLARLQPNLDVLHPASLNLGRT
jgi:hypothetical protein